jgi:hypothetical protein
MSKDASHFQPRTYRTRMAREGLVPFQVTVKETDLFILAARDLSAEARRVVVQERAQLEAYIAVHPEFLSALTPWSDDPFAPPLVRDMVAAGGRAGVGPMAAVAGAIAERVGHSLLALSSEVIVENGGDIFLAVTHPATLALYAGQSPLSYRVGLRVHPADTPLGVCTSAGTVGHSLSFGRADAACVLAPAASLADALATALGNRVRQAGDIAAALDWLAGIPGVLGGVVVVGEHLGAWGRVELIPL